MIRKTTSLRPLSSRSAARHCDGRRHHPLPCRHSSFTLAAFAAPLHDAAHLVAGVDHSQTNAAASQAAEAAGAVHYLSVASVGQCSIAKLNVPDWFPQIL